ncbi:MAG: hypothetical protein ACRDEA_22950 [Microcystaceae cyanobacterium]
MNNIQLKIRVESLEPSYTMEGNLVVNGTCSFKFYDKKANQVRPLPFVAYTQSAVTLQESGLDSVQIISGRLNVHKPTDTSPNHQPLLTVERTICLSAGKTNKSVPIRHQSAPAPQAPTIQASKQPLAEIDSSDIPF